ncbi:MAG: GNAT family N-acetyltransferase [Bacillota bacterium]|uniref:GNAT family N-acetyltransferase n=1 Tax=Virgibacillus salarius TaxID=447199 RepID=A0A941E048_9BACI|nr:MULTISPECIES: GNAT family protein [Bacillaceae]NAZ09232.1 GNAT family N-acetyltransferase [Agaribacter marinus]MBR7796523.1 GNAT family N-acetyltransferase [Virgibacillus salarius]MCC2251704.1 GNAT family N-acetyltransferase [Virgibacillus sp. AGTR]MDY7043763.1 GNAT family protein [Virgibacillus sp. M23]QRZ19426.1 GNAT family N-acetyltransferase [Virgibacillus sp. AGTR]
MLFESSRIKLRKMTIEDTDLYHQWRNDIDVMQTTSPNLDIYTFEETKSFVREVILHSSTSKSYIITVKDSGETPIGVISLIQIDNVNHNAECIIDIGNKDYWGKGYGKEAMQLLLNYAFSEMNLHRLSLRVFSFNLKAIKLYEKLGFFHEGRSRQFLYRNGKWHDLLHMGMLRTEYV